MERFRGIGKDIEKDVRELFAEHRIILFMVMIVMLGVMALATPGCGFT